MVTTSSKPEEMCPIPKPHNKPIPAIVFGTKSYPFQGKGQKRSLAIPVLPEDSDPTTVNHYKDVIKAFAMDLEEKNTNCLIFHHRGKGWWQLGGRSLLFYKHHLEGHYNLRQLTVNDDRDYGHNHWKHGCASIKNIHTLADSLEKNAKAIQVLESPHLKIFKLREKFSDSEITAFSGIETNRERRFLKLVCPTFVDPRLFKALDNLHELTIRQVVHIPQNFRDLVGHQGADLITPLVLGYNAMCNSRLDPEEYFKDAITALDTYFDWLLMIKKFHFINLETLAKMATSANDLKQAMENELTKIQGKLH